MAIATSQRAIALSVEVQLVGTVGAAGGGDDMGSMNRIGQGVDLFVGRDAATFAVRLYDLAHEQRHLFGHEAQVAQQTVIDLLHLARPSRVAGVGFALMHQHALDDAVLLSASCQLDQACIGVVVRIFFIHSGAVRA